MLCVVTAVYGMAWCHATDVTEDVTEAPGHQGTIAPEQRDDLGLALSLPVPPHKSGTYDGV
jgi:hypothetical protein